MAQGELGGVLKELGYTEDQVSSKLKKKPPFLIVIDIYVPLGFQVLNELLGEIHYLLLLTIAHSFGVDDHLLENYLECYQTRTSLFGC